MFSINRNHQLFDIFFFAKKHTLITIVRKYFMQDELFFNHPQSSIVNFWPKTQCDHHWWKVFHAQLVVFQSPTIIDCVLFFLCEKKHPSFTTFERYFTSCKSVNDHLLFVFFSRHFTFYSDRLKGLSNLKNEKNLCWYRVWSMNHDF